MEIIKSLNLLGFGILGLVLFLMVFTFKIINQYERAVFFRLGKYKKVKGPGLIFVMPLIDKIVKVDIRINSIDVPKQELITGDNVSVVVDAVVYYKVEDPQKAVIDVNNVIEASFLIAQTTLRHVIGQVELDTLLAHQAEINQKLKEILDGHTLSWGIRVVAVEIKELSLPESMKRAMARQAEAERERRSKVIIAEGEFQAAEKLRQAGEILGDPKIGVQLRYFQTLAEISVDKNSTILFPVPIDAIPGLLKK
ncbi:MAG: slipin family protein [Candidatus Omnitrophica bacterium]|nr:slipin family protein [Candidatus Omnitrophota bacterium]